MPRRRLTHMLVCLRLGVAMHAEDSGEELEADGPDYGRHLAAVDAFVVDVERQHRAARRHRYDRYRDAVVQTCSTKTQLHTIPKVN